MKTEIWERTRNGRTERAVVSISEGGTVLLSIELMHHMLTELGFEEES